jgi:dTDP-4-dehydrorhamnose 3,5-epimerase
MKAILTRIEGVVLLKPKLHRDSRGFFSESYNRQTFGELGITAQFIQDNMSFSRQAGTIRGLHYQVPPFAQTKLVRCIHGAILDVAVDLRDGSPTFGTHVSCILTAENMHQLFIPVGFAHGFSTLSPNTEVQYKVDAGYAPEYERGIACDDNDLAIDWNLHGRSAVLSEKDKNLPSFRDLKYEFLYEPGMENAECAF